MGKVNVRLRRETAVIDELTGKEIIFETFPPSYELLLTTKRSKTPYSIGWQDLLNALRSGKSFHFTHRANARPSMVKEAPKEVDYDEAIKDILAHHDSLHFSQLRQELQKKGMDISKKAAGTILKMMAKHNEVSQDKMYYSLKKVS